MRHLHQGVLLGILCSIMLLGQADTEVLYEQCVKKDSFGNPSKLIVDLYATTIPVVDGIKLVHQSSHYQGRYEYNIADHTIANKPVISNIKSYKSDYALPEAVYQAQSQLSKQNRESGWFFRVRKVDHDWGFFESKTNRQLKQYLDYCVHCQVKYGMDICAKKDLLGKSAKKFEKELLGNESLSTETIKELLKEYLSSCKKEKKENIELQQSVMAEVRSREKEELAAVKKQIEKELDGQRKIEQKKLEAQKEEKHKKYIAEQHKQVKDDLYWLDLPEELQEQRDVALEQSELESYKQYQELYELDPLSCGYLQAKGIQCREYESCYGTALQQQYHQEIIKLIKDLAYQELHLKNKTCFFDHSMNFAQATGELNRKNSVPSAGIVSWIANTLCQIGKEFCLRPWDYIKAVGQGAADSVVDVAHMMTHPDELIYGLGQMLYFAIETAAIAEAMAEYPIEAKNAFDNRCSEIHSSLSGMQKDFLDLDGPARIRSLTKFGSDFLLTPKLMHACGCLLSGVASKVKKAALEKSGFHLLSELGLEQGSLQELMHHTKELEPAAEHRVVKRVTTEFMEAEKAIGGATGLAFVVAQLKDVMKRAQKVLNKQGAIPLAHKKIKDELKFVLNALEKELKHVELEKLRRLYGQKKIDGKEVRLALDHILNFSLGVKKSRDSGGFVLKVGGGHLSGVCEALEQTGLVEIVGKKTYPNGVVDYRLKNGLSGQIFKEPKTMFPEDWSVAKILKVTWEVYEDTSLKIKDAKGGKLSKVKIIDDIEIAVYWSEKGKDVQLSNYIHSSMPYIKTGKS